VDDAEALANRPEDIGQDQHNQECGGIEDRRALERVARVILPDQSRTTEKPMKTYQVVLQLPESFFASLDEVIAFEDKLTVSLPATHDVDGHDIGSGTVNFFVYTESPQAVLRNFRKYMGTNRVEKKLRMAFPRTDGDEFENMWPKRDDRPFDLFYE
jgi:hypothetical protein